MRTSAIALAAILASSLPALAIDTNIKSYVCEKLDDFQATVTVVSANQRELGKISKDAGLLYRFKEVNMRYKEPNKLRAEGTVEGTRGVFILNGPMQYVAISTLKTKRNFGDEPGKRKTLMDVGLVSDYYLTYTDAKFLREGAVDGVPCAVFEMRYKSQFGDTSHHNVYIDPKTKVVRRRESYSQDGKLQAVYFFKEVKEIKPGVWFPTRIEAQNVDRVIAGVTAYKEIKVNVGISDDIFKL